MKMKKRYLLITTLLALLFFFSMAHGSEIETGDTSSPIELPEISFSILNYFIFKNDQDFDRSKPVYSNNGQTVGFVSTVFEPAIDWRPVDFIVFRYALEIGDNIWSRNDVDQRDPTAADVPIVKHKEFWTRVYMPCKRWGFQAGYQYFYDPTHLFIDRYMGSASFFATMDDNWIVLSAGQIPDSVYEGVNAVDSRSEYNENNFENDDYLFSLSSTFRIGDKIDLGTGLFYRWDKSEIHRPDSTLAYTLHFDWAQQGSIKTNVGFDLVGMWGRHLRAGLDNRDVQRLGGAAQTWLSVSPDPVSLRWNLLWLSADDGDRYDQWDTSFAYSGWSKSRTLILSENWIRDQYDNLDERAADQGAGLFLADQDLRVNLSESVALMLIAGYGMVTDNTHTGKENTLGTETDAGIEVGMYRDHVTFTLIGGALFPGKAGSMLQNEIDLEKTDPMFHLQGSMDVKF